MNDDRLFPTDAATRAIARRLFREVRDLPIISPHGHTDPRWFAENEAFEDPARLFVTPDHYVFRMLYSQGVPLEDLGVPRVDGGPVETDPRKIWRRFAEHYRLFAGTPTRLWLDHSFETLFGLGERLSAANADRHYDVIADALRRPEFRPRALFEKFNIEVIATTESALDDLRWHRMIRESGWRGRVVTTYRPDSVVDPHFPGFRENIGELGAITGEDTATWTGYLAAHRKRRAFFKSHGATASDHGHPSAATADLAPGRSGGVVLEGSGGGAVRRRRRAFSRANADGDGGDEPRRRARHADPSRLMAQPQSASSPAVRPRQGRRYSDAD